jgi:hypothetical protein
LTRYRPNSILLQDRITRQARWVKELVILGGPNGAGKTTAAQIVVPRKLDIGEFINADEIARGLSPFNPDGAALAAGRLMLQRMRALADGERSFAIETTVREEGTSISCVNARTLDGGLHSCFFGYRRQRLPSAGWPNA